MGGKKDRGRKTRGGERVRDNPERTKGTKMLKDKIEKIIAESLRQSIKDIPNEVKRGVRETVAKALGFDVRWSNKWEVDHCNGRNSYVGQMVAQTAKDKVAEVIRKASKEFEPNKSQVDAIKRDMEEVFYREFRRAMKAEIEKFAIAKAQELVRHHLPNLKDAAFDMAKSLINPDFGSNELEKLAMELHVEEIEGFGSEE